MSKLVATLTEDQLKDFCKSDAVNKILYVMGTVDEKGRHYGKTFGLGTSAVAIEDPKEGQIYDISHGDMTEFAVVIWPFSETAAACMTVYGSLPRDEEVSDEREH